VYETAHGCAQVNQDNFYSSDAYAPFRLTVGTGDPALPPWWEGGETDEHAEWRLNDPYLGRGFEGAVAFEVAERMGFRRDRVTFVPTDFSDSIVPGPKPFDFALQQIPSFPGLAEHVDLSQGYAEVSQALVSVRGSPIVTATSLDDLKKAALGVATGTIGLHEIEETIRPDTQPTAYEGLTAAVRGLKAGRVDGIVVDLPSASFLTEEQIPDGVIVGRLPTQDRREHLVMAFEKGSPITQCVDLAIQEMKDDGTLARLHKKWLAGTTEAPLIDD
jgi:polar amino acid transport system substrate-binding protein